MKNLLLPFVLLLSTLSAQNCANASIGAVPLTDLGAGSYQGFPGGLYPNGQNVVPPAHLALGQSHMAAVVPRAANGLADPAGRIVVLSLGMSNTTQEFSTWVTQANADPSRNPAVTVIDGAQGGQDAVTIADPAANFWTVVDQRLATAGLTPQQVQVVWLKEAIAGVSGGFPAAATQLQDLLAQIARIAKARYPNTQLCFCSSRTYAGYATSTLNPEPYAYESGFAVKWLLEQQMNGDPWLNCDAAAGTVVAPWLGFGPYLWADGLTPRSDGLVWTCADVQADGTHPSASGRDKVAAMLQAFFHQDVLAAPWYVGQGTPALFAVYGVGCPGVAGLPQIASNSLPQLGNGNFRIGVQHAAPSSIVALCLGYGDAQLPIVGGCHLLVDPSSGLTIWPGITNAAGVRIEPLPIANQPSLVGAELFCQWLVDDNAGTPWTVFAGLATSGGAHLVVGL